MKKILQTELKLTCHEDGAKHEKTHLQPDLQNFQRLRYSSLAPPKKLSALRIPAVSTI